MVLTACLASALLICCGVVGESRNWRFSSFQLDPDIFTTRLPFTVETHEVVPADWCHPHSCSINATSYSSATVHCTRPGFHKLGLKSTQVSTGYIHVVDSPFCYEWHVMYSQITSNNTLKGLFRVWIFDPKLASKEESNQTALVPPKLSGQISAIFNSLGQKPSLKITIGYRSNQQQLHVLREEFVSQFRFWEIEVERLQGHQTVVWVDSQSVALNDCFVRARRKHIVQPKFPAPESQTGKILRGRATFSYIVQMPCAANVAVFVSKFKFLLSQDYFATWKELYIREALLKGSEPLVQSVSFTRDNMLLLLESGKVIVYNGVLGDFLWPSGLPEEVVIVGIQALTTCFAGHSSKVASNVAVAWCGKNTINKLYLSRDEGRSFKNINVSVSSVEASISWQIYDVQCHSLVPAVYLLVNVKSVVLEKVVLLEYNYIEKIWRELDIELQILNTHGSLSFTFTPPSTQHVVIWSQYEVAAGAINSTAKPLLLGNKTKVFKGISSNSTISSVVAWKGGNGEFLVLLSDNRLFYARIDIEYAVELSLGETPDTQVAMMFNLLGNLLLLVNRSSTIKRRVFPLKNEILSSLYPNVDCPYKEFVTSISPELQFVDKGEQIMLWALLVYPKTAPNDIILQMSRTDLLMMQTEHRRDYNRGLVILNKTFTLFHETARQNSGHRSSGAVAVSVHPSLSALSCDHVTPPVLNVEVGCPLSRNIKIRNCSASPGTANETATDVDALCVFTSAFDGQVRVLIDMYDGDGLVSEVTGDYFVWEENGRDDYGYSATVTQAGCLQKAQTKKEMMMKDGKVANDSTMWNQDNYRSCFEAAASDSTYDADQPYEILNSSGVSRISFSGSGLYQFTLKVLQSDLSFCELTARFSVDVEKEPAKSKHLAAVSSFTTVTLICTMLLSVSYFFYRRNTLQIHQEDEQQVQRLQELKYLYTTLKQLPGGAGSVAVGGSISSYAGGQRSSTSHNVRRMSGAAGVMLHGGLGSTGRIPRNQSRSSPGSHPGSRPASLEKLVEEPSSTSLRSRKSST